MPDWRRLNREAGKALIAGVTGGVMAQGQSFTFPGGLADNIAIMMLYGTVVLFFAVFEWIYGKPRQSEEDEMADSESKSRQKARYAS